MVDKNRARAQQIHDLLPKVEFAPILKGSDDVLLAKYAKGSKKGEYVVNLDQKQQLFLAQQMSRQIYPNRDFRFTVLPIQTSYDLVHANTRAGKAFKELNEARWFHNREAFKRANGRIFAYPDPVVVEVQGNLRYEGDEIDILVYDNVVDTLRRSGLLTEPKHKIYCSDRYSEIFDENNESSVRSHWTPIFGGSFYLNADRPGGCNPHVLAGFVKTNKKPVVEKVEARNVDHISVEELEKVLSDTSGLRQKISSTARERTPLYY